MYICYHLYSRSQLCRRPQNKKVDADIFKEIEIAVASMKGYLVTPPTEYNEKQSLFSPPLVEVEEEMLKNFFPISLLDTNCGTKDGLEQILVQYRPLIEDQDRYFVLTVDINMYYRILRVCANVDICVTLQR